MARVARLGDSAAGTCTAHSGGPRAWTGVFDTSTGGFTIGGVQAVSINDSGPTSCGHTFRFLGSSSILTGAGGRTIAREGDEVIVDQGGTGVITSGSDIMASD